MDVLLAGRQVTPTCIPVVVAAGLGLWLMWQWRKGKPDPQVMVGRVSEILLHPVKSASGVPLTEAMCTPIGIKLPGTEIVDRHLIITTSDYNFITQRQKPSLALIKPSIHDNDVHLDAPEMDTLVVNLDASGSNCTVRMWGQRKSARDFGDETSRWLSKYLKMDGVRLCIAESEPTNRFLKQVKWEPYTAFYQQQQVKKGDQVAFADMSPYMVISQASLDDLNSRTDTPLSMRNFRPSIVVSGCSPYDEDNWRHMKIGDARFSFFMLCNRCMLTQVNPDTGTRREDQEPLKTLRTYRLLNPVFGKSPCFGTHWVLDNPGTIRVGDPVYVSRAK